MSPGTVDAERCIVSVCPICKRMYWTNGFCSHGLLPPPPPKAAKPEDDQEPMKKTTRRDGGHIGAS